MAIGSVVRRVFLGLAVAVAVGGFGVTRHVIEHHRVIGSGDASLIALWTTGGPPPPPGAKAIEPTNKQYGGGYFLMAVGLGLAAALALPGRPRSATPHA